MKENDKIKLMGSGEATSAIVDAKGVAINKDQSQSVQQESSESSAIETKVIDLKRAASVPEDNIVLHFGVDSQGNDRSMTLPIYTLETPDGIAKSISRIMPMDEEVLVAEYGMIGVMELLTQGNSMKAAAFIAIVGLGDKVSPKYKLGMNFMPKMMDTHVMRHTFDPQNQYSFEMLSRNAKENKEMLAAVTIVGRKDQTRVGLRMDSQFIDPEVIKKAEALKAKKNFGPVLYKDDKVEFLNYRLMHVSNISAIVL